MSPCSHSTSRQSLKPVDSASECPLNHFGVGRGRCCLMGVTVATSSSLPIPRLLTGGCPDSTAGGGQVLMRGVWEPSGTKPGTQ